MQLSSLIFLTLLSFCSSYSNPTIDESMPVRGKIYHPGNLEHFHNAINTYDLVIVDFYADWCGPCKMMHKVIDELAQAKEFEDILFIKINTDVQRHISNHFNITSLPTIIFFVDGQPINRVYGYQNKKQMKEIIGHTFRSPKN